MPNMTTSNEEIKPLLSDARSTVTSNDAGSRVVDSSPYPQIATHCHVPDDKFDYSARNRLIMVLILCIFFITIEVTGGILSNSIAVITDAAHMFIDAATFVVSLAALYLGRKRPTSSYSFGYVRAEVIGVLSGMLTIWLVTAVLFGFAIYRLIDQRFQVEPNIMLIVASFGVFFNIIMFIILHVSVCGNLIPHYGHSHDDDHDHSNDSEHGLDHSYTHTNSHAQDNHELEAHQSQLRASKEESKHSPNAHQQKKSHNLNIRAATIHVIGDFVQSIGVLIAAIIIKIKPEYKLADPICTILFSIIVLITTITVTRDINRILMEGTPVGTNYAGILEDLHRIPGVRVAHSLRIWSLSMNRTVLSVHLAINSTNDYASVLAAAQQMLRTNHSINDTTIQVEPYDDEIMNGCEKCKSPEA